MVEGCAYFLFTGFSDLPHRLGTPASGNSPGPVPENKKRPPTGGRPVRSVRLLGRFLLRHLRLHRLSAADRDLARLGRLGHLMHHLDMQHAFVEIGR